MKWPKINQVAGENPFVTYFKRETLRRNQCINALATGKTGSGKSWGMLQLLFKADNTFNVDRVFFRASELLNWTNKTEDLKGKAFLFDEAGVDADATEWWNDINRALKLFLQTMRSRNYILGITVPFTNEISAAVRRHINVRFYAEGYEGQMTKFRGLIWDYNDDMDKYYKKRLMVKDLEGNYMFCDKLLLPKAEENLIMQYEAKKKQWQSIIENELKIKLAKHEAKRTGAKQELSEIENKVLETAKIAKSDLEGAIMLKISLDAYRHIKRAVKNKGYTIEKPYIEPQYAHICNASNVSHSTQPLI